MDEDLQAHWDELEVLLACALDGCNAERCELEVNHAREFLAHREYGLAAETLRDLSASGDVALSSEAAQALKRALLLMDMERE
ncbi:MULTISPECIES: hypothetical protein [unclassified Chelatococcus]|uniref:hypothetical protein n=1 Tax=unclassified Chelatococcus TaxID=2638111 RepID=UPI001BCF238A|nr:MULTISPECIES: hypothetical protein [unclassified Chelatococcus]CAH1672452.1 conserved hypothetical protein [Hyphomicrobiales bacterium]MBS7738948.1 hypothetical protein [Chelatococcus sp. HY11]MBX3543381.1 hypothetical protein [Chelatococcus sp.]MCO5076523.1 hypothetical protein [Chelatococcus sp.]CAH1675310.1 conserved hypothetical protein [Hyphomicrobiales bacterium]